MIVAGPGVRGGQVSDVPVNLVDVNATVLTAIGLEAEGESLIDVAEADSVDRLTFSEYHDGGSTCGFYMVRTRRWKYICYVGHDPHLFDTEADPDELVDLSQFKAHAEQRDWMHAELLKICDPVEVNNRASASQELLVEQLGGPDVIGAALRFNHTPVPN